MHLHQLIEQLDVEPVNPCAKGGEIFITHLTDDSRKVGAGSLFIARSGPGDDGSRYLAHALNQKAAAIVFPRSVLLEEALSTQAKEQGCAFLHAARVDQALAGRLAERFFGYPGKALRLVGITGTKGKTTVAFLTQQLLNAAGMKAGMIGTVCIDDGASVMPAQLTTPGAIEFSQYLASMVKNGCMAAVAEVSSHALHQGRIGALCPQVGVFTNLTGDHLDYHGSMEEYARAKAILFEKLSQESFAVVNMDDPYVWTMLEHCQAKVITCSLESEKAQAYAQILHLGSDKTQVRLCGPWGELEVGLPMIGRHNVMNVLQAVAAAHCLSDIELTTLREALEEMSPPPGRLEPVHAPAGMSAEEGGMFLPTVLVDYAHTHDALEKTLQTLKPICKGQFICVFGCGGDRDRTKRPKMAAVAHQWANVVVLTSDNPRTEDPDQILHEVLAGFPSDTVIAHVKNIGEEQVFQAISATTASGVKVFVHPDRRTAIRLAIALAGPADMVLLAGKGHENYQIIGTMKRHFDDREEAAEALSMKQAWGEKTRSGSTMSRT